MNKLGILTISVALLSITACDKLSFGSSSTSKDHKRFVEMCQEDPRAKTQNFDCSCQADIIQAVLKQEEMDNLIAFLDVEKQNKDKAIEMGKDPKYAPMFQKIAGIGLAIHDKCGQPGADQASTQAAPAAAPAPAAEAPAATAPAATAPAAAPAPATK